jgi:hypothetical protein
MKIPFKRLMSSTNLSGADLIKNIVFKLEKSGYDITGQDSNHIEFKHDIWRFGSRSEAFEKLDGGRFEIHPENGNVIFTFYVSLTSEVLATGVVMLINLIQDPYILFFIVFIWLIFLLRVLVVKAVAKQMMVNVTNAA